MFWTKSQESQRKSRETHNMTRKSHTHQITGTPSQNARPESGSRSHRVSQNHNQNLTLTINTSQTRSHIKGLTYKRSHMKSKTVLGTRSTVINVMVLPFLPQNHNTIQDAKRRPPLKYSRKSHGGSKLSETNYWMNSCLVNKVMHDNVIISG